MRCGPASAPRQSEPSGGALGIDEFLEELGMGGERLGRRARQQRRILVAQGQEARGFEPDDRGAGGDMGGERVDHALRLDPRLVDEAGGEKGAAAAQWPAAPRVRAEDAIAGAGQYALGGAGVLGLEPAVEGVDQQDHVAPVVTPSLPSPASGGGLGWGPTPASGGGLGWRLAALR